MDLISQERNDVDSYYLVDGLGSTRGLTDENGNVTDVYHYDAYGNLTDSVGSSENSYLFAGEQFDENLDQYYLRQRYYDPSVGRFTRRDTYEGDQFNPITLHKYIYANANPFYFIDPSGFVSSLSEQNAANAIRTELSKIYGQLLETAIDTVVSGGGSLSLEGLASEVAWNLAPPLLEASTDFIKHLGRGIKASTKRAELIREGLRLGKFKQKGGNNLAFADIRIGNKGKEFSGTLVALSGNTRTKLLTGNQIAPTGLVGNVSGKANFIPMEVDGYLRHQDTERKILEAVANQYADNRYVKGKIYMFSERRPCQSCTERVIREFKKMFPNLKLEVRSRYH